MAETILVVDDNASARDLAEELLTEAGYQTRLAADGVAALALVAEGRPDLILLDIMMPRMSGLEACRRLKEDPSTAEIPVLVVTAVRQIATKEAAIECGADDFITKPIRQDDLLARVAALLKVRGVRQDVDRMLAYLHALDTETQAHRTATLREAGVAMRGETAPPGGSATILIVDGEALTRNFYGNLLSEQGHFVFMADSPMEGFAIMDANPVEVVILAEQMTGFVGRDILARIRSVRPEIPVIMLVNDTRPTNAALVVNHGAFDLIIKGMHITLATLAVTRAVRYAREIARPRMGARARPVAETLPAIATGKG